MTKIERAHLDALPILIEFIKKLKTHPELRDEAWDTLNRWDKARTPKDAASI